MTSVQPNSDDVAASGPEAPITVAGFEADPDEWPFEPPAARARGSARASDSTWLRLIVDQSTDAIAVCTPRLDVVYGNLAWRTLLQRAAAPDLRGLMKGAVHPSDLDEVERFREAVAHPSESVSIDIRLQLRDGWRWHRVLVTNLIEDAAVGGLVLNFRDITDRKRAALLQQVLADFSVVAATSDSVERLIADGQRAAGVALDMSPSSLSRLDVGWPVVPAPYQLDEAEADAVEDDRPITPAERHHLQIMAQMMTSTIDRMAAQAELRYQARHDPLTGLANRALLDERLERLLALADASGSAVAVYLLDLDAFKLINDSLGHGCGDAILREIGFRLRQSVREDDITARFGGDEFVVAALVGDSNEAMALAHRLQACFEAPIPIEGLDYFVTASIGVSLSGPDAQTPPVLLRSADVAMHTGKSRGRGCLTVFTDAMHARSSRHLDVHRRLRAAIENGQVRVHYQPVIELRSNQIIGVEALARWTDPDLGQIAPTEFIGVAEESGLIVPLGRHLVEVAVQDISRLERRYPLVDLTLAVNVSAKELTVPGYTQSLRSTLSSCGFDPAKLVVELTETSLVADPRNALQAIKELRSFGTKVAIDDFGTGFSSLQTLRDYPIDFLKIHSSFISGADSKENWAIVASIIALAASVGAHAVAEGVEAVPQLQALRRLRCEHAQGFFWAPSMPIDELHRWIEANDRRSHRTRARR